MTDWKNAAIGALSVCLMAVLGALYTLDRSETEATREIVADLSISVALLAKTTEHQGEEIDKIWLYVNNLER